MKLFVSDLIKKNRKGILYTPLKGFLYLFSLLFGALSQLKNFAYEKKILPSYSPQIPLTISIGNIVAGGTGKTPFALLLLQKLPVALITRGYKSPLEHKSSTIICDGNGPLFTSEVCGDEPYLLAKNAPNSLIIVGKNRKTSAVIAEKRGCKMLLIEDGFQHRALHRDLDIVLLNYHDLFGKGYFLPRGFLRESPQHLKRADLIIINHVKTLDEFKKAQREITPFTNALILGCYPKIVLDSYFQGKKAAIFSAIANPENFKASLEQKDIFIVAEMRKADHETFSENELLAYAQEAKKMGAQFLLCTEKDFVKIKDSHRFSLPIICSKMELEFLQPELWQKILEICLHSKTVKNDIVLLKRNGS
jgi:tetraacyldisaccharide 4'-kinase